jgi:hypothetical protein
MKRFVATLLLWSIGGFVVGFSISYSIRRAAAPRLASTVAAVPPETAGAGHVFSTDAGLMIKFVRPERAADFEATVARLKQAFAVASTSDERRQAAGWRVFKASGRATNGDLIYVFMIEPVVHQADYTTSRILARAFPAEAASLYQRYAAASSGDQAVLELNLIAALGDQPSR